MCGVYPACLPTCLPVSLSACSHTHLPPCLPVCMYASPPVVTLQRHLRSNVCSKFHENMGILKPISRNRDMWCFLPEISWNPPKKGYILTPYFELSWDLSAMNYFQWTCHCAIYNDVRKNVFEIVQTDKLSLYYEFMNIYKYGEKSSFKHFSFFS